MLLLGLLITIGLLSITANNLVNTFLSEKEVNYVDRIKRMKPKPFDPEELKPKTSEFDDLDWE